LDDCTDGGIPEQAEINLNKKYAARQTVYCPTEAVLSVEMR
jgi:hypothetical protein